MMRIFSAVAVAIALAACGPSQSDVAVARSSLGGEVQYSLSDRLRASDGDDDRNYGRAVATRGDRIAIGASRREPDGAVYIYDRSDSWLESQIIESPPDSEDFGRAVAMDGDVLLVAGTSRLYFYITDATGSYALADSFAHPSPETDDGFGAVIALDGTVAAVSARHHSQDGAVWVVEATNPEMTSWQQSAVLTVADRDFGRALAIHGGRLAVGARKAGAGTSSQGLVFMFDRQVDGTWLETARVESETPTDYDEFGQAVDLGLNRFVTGATGTSVAYIYELDASAGWIQTAVLAPDYEVVRFASAVALDGEFVAASTIFDPNRVWVWRHDGMGWVAAGIGHNADTNFNYLGSSLTFNEGTLVVGAPDPAVRGGGGTIRYLEGWAQVMELNHSPTVATASISVEEDVSVNLLPALEALDADGDSIAVEVVEGAAHGTISSGTAVATHYRGAEDYNGADGAVIALVDARGARTLVELAIDVTPVNDAPRASAIETQTAFESPIVIAVDGSDPEGDDFHVIVSSLPEHGMLTAEDESLTYVPDPGWVGFDFAEFRLSDGVDESIPLKLTVRTLKGDADDSAPDAGDAEVDAAETPQPSPPESEAPPDRGGCCATSGSPRTELWPLLSMALLVAVRNRSSSPGDTLDER